MPEPYKKRLSATFEVQVRIDAEWQVTHAVEDREGAVLEAIALIGQYRDEVPIRVVGELHDALTNSIHPRVIWAHKPPPKPRPAILYEERREARIKARDGSSGRRQTTIGLAAVVLIGFALLVYYVGTHIDMYNVRH
ncbi:MAG TPA: hypothetical protein VGV37_24600 [Aliidongia sp.]|uniref:hypothetical protein n=1 Tax=Aliidongia sp. TaxID=1914230 RepID=UPI002DDD5619|nr:hypothetical protein [Aliidongia sp.]HEV2677734.1 hypothetical protein [Aliidongia sp.]